MDGTGSVLPGQEIVNREFRLALADNPYAPAPWRTYEYIMREAGIIGG